MKITIMVFLLLTSIPAFANFQNFVETDSYLFDEYEEIEGLEEILDEAEMTATPDGKAILITARAMIANKEIVLGSCWDYINAIFDKAGYPNKSRPNIFKSKQAGPYADINLVQTGDWLYFINHSYGDVEHSGIFVAWMDDSYQEALLISYVGGNRAVPARYKSYDLSSIYNIMRPKKK